jgi:hypothetical protein
MIVLRIVVSLVTGPIGLVVGGIGGCLYALTRPGR